MINKRILLQVAVIVLLGLLPLLWFPDGKVILGHDSGLPFDPLAHFVDRLYLWSTHFGLGIDLDNGLLGSVFVIHGLETFLGVLGFSLQNVEKIEFIFWFVLPGLSMYYVAYKIWPDKKYLPLIAALIYMINYYLLQAWFAPERTKFSFYAGFPIIIYSMLEYFRGKMSWQKSVFLAGITFSIFNGGGSIPLYGGLFITIFCIAVYYNFIAFSLKSLFKTAAFLVGIGSIYLLLNAYWIIPYVKYLLGSFNTVLANQGGTDGTLNWTAYLSTGASFINLLRGQGIPDWYLNPYHAYAASFVNNPILIFASFLFPLLAFSALFLAKNNRDRYYLYIIALTVLLSLIFTSGTKSQLSFIYTTLVTKVPGFAIFRSSFYKFDYVLWFGYAFLIGYTLDYLLEFFEQRIKRPTVRTVFPLVALAGFVLALLLYHYPVLNGSFFDYSHEPGKELTTRIHVPKYVFDFDKWVNQQDQTTRYLVLPEINDGGSFISYKWGFWSLATIPSLMARNSFVQNDASTGGEAKDIVNALYKALKNNDMKTFNNIAHMLGINAVVLQKDYDWQNKQWGTTNPEIYEKIIKNSNNFTLEKTFGEWQVYGINSEKEQSRIAVSNKLDYVQGDLASVVAMPNFDSRAAVFTDSQGNTKEFLAKATDIYISPACNNCSLKGIQSTFTLYNPKVLPGSLLYPFVVAQEKKVKDNAKDFNSLFNYYLTFSDRRVAEAKWMSDSNQNMNALPGVFNNYDTLLSEFRTLLDEKNWAVTSAEESDMSQQLIAHLLEQSKIIESLYQNDQIGIESKMKLASSYDLLSQLIDAAQKKVWATRDTKDKLYNFDVPQSGQYHVMVQKSSFSEPDKDAGNAQIMTRDTTQAIKSTKEIDGWLDFGTLQVKEGKNYLTLIDPTVSNLLQGVKPILPGDATGIIVANGVYTLTSQSQDKCFAVPLRNLDTNSVYQISFKFKNFIPDKDLAFYIDDLSTTFSALNLKEHFLTNSLNVIGYAQNLKPTSDKSDLVFCNGFSDLRERYSRSINNTGPTSNDIVAQVQDISLYKLSTPTIVLYQNKVSKNDTNTTVSFQRKSPVSYNVNIGDSKEPTTIIMKESYGKAWQLCSESKQCLSLDDSNHFTNAGFSNAWYFDNGLSGKYTLYYTNQRLFYYGLAVSILSALAMIGLFVWNTLWKKRN
jgi:hypothetical protein